MSSVLKDRQSTLSRALNPLDNLNHPNQTGSSSQLEDEEEEQVDDDGKSVKDTDIDKISNVRESVDSKKELKMTVT